MAADADISTIGEVASEISRRTRAAIRPWMIRRLIDRGLLPVPRRVGPYRVFTAKDLPQIERAVREAGYAAARPKRQRRARG